MSGGHWNYLSHKLQDRIGESPDEVWRLLAKIEHELDWGICGDICYECAKIRVIEALEAYFDTEATRTIDAIRILDSSTPECTRCREWKDKKPQPPAVARIHVYQDGKIYKGTVTEVKEG